MATIELKLSPSVISYLEAIVQDDTNESRKKRAQLLLLYNEGLETAHVASQVGLSQSRVRYWRRQFINRAMDIFGPAATLAVDPAADPPRPKKKDRISDDDLAKKVKSIKKKLKSKKLKAKKVRKLKAKLKSLERDAKKLAKKRKKKSKKGKKRKTS